MANGETYELPSGKKAEITDFKGKHVSEAMRLIDGDSSRTMSALISITTKIDGKKITIEEVDEMDGRDVLFLYGKFGSSL